MRRVLALVSAAEASWLLSWPANVQLKSGCVPCAQERVQDASPGRSSKLKSTAVSGVQPRTKQSPAASGKA